MDKSISTISDYKQYLKSIQKIYLKQSFLLPMDRYLGNKNPGIGLRIGFNSGKPYEKVSPLSTW